MFSYLFLIDEGAIYTHDSNNHHFFLKSVVRDLSDVKTCF